MSKTQEITIEFQTVSLPVQVIKAIKGGNIIKLIEKQEVKTEKDEAEASLLASKLNKYIKNAEKKRLEIQRPARQKLDAYKKEFDVKVEPYRRAFRLIRSKIDAYIAENRRIEAKAERKRLAEEERRRKISIAKGGTGEVIKPVATVPAVLDTKTTRTRKVWTYDRDNIDFNKLPDAYKCIDFAKITQAVRSGTREIPGVKIFEQEQSQF